MNKIQELLKLYEKASQADKKKLYPLIKLYDRTNEVYWDYYDNQSRYLVLMGGGGSGKSIFAGQKLIRRMTTQQGHRFLVVRKVGKTLRESCFQQLKTQMYDYSCNSLFEFNHTDLRIKYKPNSSEIIFSGLDDVEKLKSIYNITGIWIEEASELTQEDFQQLDIRLRGQTEYYKQIILTFNPISVSHWLKAYFFDRKSPDATTSHTTYKDNRFLDEAAIKVLESFKETDPYYYMVYALGQWGVLGKTVFDAMRVQNRITQLTDPTLASTPTPTPSLTQPLPTPIQGRFDPHTHTFIPDANGMWTVYHPPEPNQRYVAGIDLAEGTANGDYDAIQILNSTTYEQVATFHGRIDIDMFAEEATYGGYYYNKALLTPEVNFNPGFVLNLQRLKYPRIYMRQQTDSISHDIQHKYGFRTDKYNRQGIISDLVEFVRDHTDKLYDLTTLDEMLTFIRDDRGKPVAQEGKHDDLIMALAIALHAALSGQGGTAQRPNQQITTLKDLPADCQDDYFKASKEDRLKIIKKWCILK